MVLTKFLFGNGLIKPGLFVYECVKILILAAFVALQPAISAAMLSNDLTSFPVLVFASSGALFPIMALFICLDTSRYKAYLPLFIAGKSISIISFLGWSIIIRRLTMIKEFSAVVFAEWLLLCGDLLALAAIILIYKESEKIAETSAMEVK